MSSRRTHPTFLLADSDTHARNLLAEVLRAAGYFMIDTVRDGNELLERTADILPQVVITASAGRDYSIAHSWPVRPGIHASDPVRL
jgi:AmiR/NasT family two-component response regulator